MGLSTKRGPNVKMFLGQGSAPESSEEKFWSSLCTRVGNGQAIPVISGSMVYDMVFRQALGDESTGEEGEEGCGPGVSLTAANILSMAWASSIDYPFPDSHELARVAQYLRSKHKVSVPAKEEYLRFLKEALLSYAAQTGADEDHIAELHAGLDEYTFAELAVKELELVDFSQGNDNPLSVLARLPLPIYVTTSYHEFLEMALESAGKHPITQVCFWSGTISPLPEKYRPLENFEPSPERPLVFHLFGLDRFPLSMVLSEDDHMDFVVEVAMERGTSRSVIPAYLQSALCVSWLMVLGYRMQDWDFRTVFRSIIHTRDKRNSPFLNLIIQLALDRQYSNARDEEVRDHLNQARDYLQDYLKTLSFEIRWSEPGSFMTKLLEELRARRQR